jgi:hypothetical protein
LQKINIRSILVPVLVTALLLLGLELISKLVLSRIYNRRFDSSLIDEHKYGSSSGLKANASGVVWGKAFHTDEMGGRRQVHSKKGKPKLLIIGDSVTEGVGVEDSATFANLLNNSSDSFDVRNISLIGWSVADYKNALDTIIAEDHLHNIKKVCLFYCLNDIYGSTPVKDFPVIARKGILSRVNGLLQNRYATYRLIKLSLYQNSDRYYQYDKALYWDSIKLNNALHTLFLISEQCKERNIVFEVFILPYRSQLYTHNDQPQQILSAMFNIGDITYYNLLPPMLKAGSPDDLYLFADEIHLSPKGHQAIANIIAK